MGHSGTFSAECATALSGGRPPFPVARPQARDDPSTLLYLIVGPPYLAPPFPADLPGGCDPCQCTKGTPSRSSPKKGHRACDGIAWPPFPVASRPFRRPEHRSLEPGTSPILAAGVGS